MLKRVMNKLRIFKRLRLIEAKLEELSKKTVSGRTTGDVEGASIQQIVDEWLNGEGEKNE